MDREKITVYVRKGAHDQERLITFKRPDHIPAKEFLKYGLALDGNQLMFEIVGLVSKDGNHPGTAYFVPDFGDKYGMLDMTTLTGGLNIFEEGLAAFLDKHGYDVEFA